MSEILYLFCLILDGVVLCLLFFVKKKIKKFNAHYYRVLFVRFVS